MPDDCDRGKPGKKRGSLIGRAVIDDEDVLGVPRDLSEYILQVLLFIMNGDRYEKSHRVVKWWTA